MVFRYNIGCCKDNQVSKYLFELVEHFRNKIVEKHSKSTKILRFAQFFQTDFFRKIPSHMYVQNADARRWKEGSDPRTTDSIKKIIWILAVATTETGKQWRMGNLYGWYNRQWRYGFQEKANATLSLGRKESFWSCSLISFITEYQPQLRFLPFSMPTG